MKATKSLFRIHKTREKGKLIFQMGTANADLAVEAAKIVAEDVAGIDVNAGCPKVPTSRYLTWKRKLIADIVALLGSCWNGSRSFKQPHKSYIYTYQSM